MSKNKKELTPTQKKKKYKRLSRSCVVGEITSVLTPFVIYAGVNYEKYFIQVDGYKMSISFYLALALMGIATWLVSKRKLQNTFTTLIIGWAAITFIFYLMGLMIQDITYIMAYGLIGLCGAWILDKESVSLNNKVQRIEKNIKQAEDENEIEAYKEELKNNKKS